MRNKLSAGILFLLLFWLPALACSSIDYFQPPLIPTDTPQPDPTNTPTTVPTQPIQEIPSSTPEANLTVDFDTASFVYECELIDLIIEVPLGWEVRENEELNSVFVTDDWQKITKADPYRDAIGIFIQALVIEESTSSTMEDIEKNLDDIITQKLGQTNIEFQEPLEIAWAEYLAKPAIDGDGSDLYYLIALVTDGDQSVNALMTVYSDRQEEVKPLFLNFIRKIQFP